jgi:hypothetical protein
MSWHLLCSLESQGSTPRLPPAGDDSGPCDTGDTLEDEVLEGLLRDEGPREMTPSSKSPAAQAPGAAALGRGEGPGASRCATGHLIFPPHLLCSDRTSTLKPRVT